MQPSAFQYVTVTQALAEHVASEMEAGHSALVLGAAGSGKYILALRAQRWLCEAKAGPVVDINFDHAPALTQRSEIRELVSGACRAAGVSPPKTESLLGGLDSFERCVYLFLANLTALPTLLLRELLGELRERSNREEPCGKVVVFLAGAHDLRNHVYGPASELANFFTRRYVFQGCDFDCFDDYVRQYIPYTAIPLPDRETRYFIWDQTGGDADLMTRLVGAIIRFCHQRGTPPAQITLTRPLVEQVIASGIHCGFSDIHILRAALRIVPAEIDLLWMVRRLVRDRACTLDEPEVAPQGLTLSGLTRRTGNKVKFASPLTATAAKRVFNGRFFGDSYAKASRWAIASIFFEKLPPTEKIRPVNGVDMSHTRDTIQAARFALDKRALASSFQVRRFFAQICRHVLGFPDVCIWEKRNKWEALPVDDGTRPASETCNALLVAFGTAETAALGTEVFLPLPWEGSSLAWRLTINEGGRNMMAVVGDFTNRTLINPDRQELLREFAEAFDQSHRHALEREENERSQRFHKIQNEILAKVLNSLGVEIFGVDAALKLIAPDLTNLGYKRIGFALVDPTRTKIYRLVDPINTPGVEARWWWIIERDSGVQPHVVASGTPLLIDDAKTHRLTDHDLCESQNIVAFAVVPILAQDGSVVGTINIERSDSVVPSRKEVDDFISFGKSLQSLMEQAERVSLLQGSLDLTPDPHVIVDVRKRLRYCNDPAARLFGGRAGWRQAPREALPTSEETRQLEPLAKYLSRALEGHRVTYHELAVSGHPDFKGSLTAAELRNESKERTGAFAHIEDLTYVYKFLAALDCVVNAHDRPSAIAAILHAAEILEHKWARLYLISPENPNVLVSEDMFGGVCGEGVESAFKKHEYEYTRSDPESEHAWQAIDKGEPLVFRLDSSNGVGHTPRGLAVLRTTNPGPLHFNADLQFWVIAPLIAAGQPLGCVSLECSERLLPEHFHFLKVFFSLVAQLFAVNLQHDLDSTRKSALAHARATRLSLAMLSHNLATRIVGFSPLIANYESASLAANPQIRELNVIFREAYEDVRGVLVKAKETFGLRPLSVCETDLVSLAESVLADSLADTTWRVAGTRGQVSAQIDQLQMKSALKEIVQNSVDLAEKGSLKINITETIRHGEPWARMVIEDRGPGVPEALKIRIFEDFFTERPGREPGSGLGLALTKRVIEAHGGRIRETGKPGHGARFVVELPQRSREEMAGK